MTANIVRGLLPARFGAGSYRACRSTASGSSTMPRVSAAWDNPGEHRSQELGHAIQGIVEPPPVGGAEMGAHAVQTLHLPGIRQPAAEKCLEDVAVHPGSEHPGCPSGSPAVESSSRGVMALRSRRRPTTGNLSKGAASGLRPFDRIPPFLTAGPWRASWMPDEVRRR